jgi:hypothetical protein
MSLIENFDDNDEIHVFAVDHHHLNGQLLRSNMKYLHFKLTRSLHNGVLQGKKPKTMIGLCCLLGIKDKQEVEISLCRFL